MPRLMEAAPLSAPGAEIGPRINIRDLTFPQLTAWMKAAGEPAFRAKQVFQWLYQRQVASFEEMANVSKALKAKLSLYFHLGEVEEAARAVSQDGSVKFVHQLADGELVESVLMPGERHITLCVSSQVGCAMKCDFCMTGKMGLTRNLTPGEIVQQVVNSWRTLEEGQFIRNIVFMGMGEPFHNYDNVMTALDILTDDLGFGFSNRRVTISTSGLVPAIRRYAAEGRKANLAISLNGVTDELRSQLMPVNKRWPLEKLLEACREFPLDTRHRITFEYILMKGTTDSLDHARKLVKLLHGLKAKVNLIPFNPGPGSPYKAPEITHCRAFQEVLLNKGLLATLRISRGQDIAGACGQLTTKEKEKRQLA